VTAIESYEIIDPWVFSTLANDPAVHAVFGDRISNGLSASAWTDPYVVFTEESTRSVRGVGGTLLDTDSIYTIVGVARGTSYSVISTGMKRVRELLDERNVTVSAPVAASIACFWESGIRAPEVSEGVPYVHLGAAWRIRAMAL
jgi:hypothetical protein